MIVPVLVWHLEDNIIHYITYGQKKSIPLVNPIAVFSPNGERKRGIFVILDGSNIICFLDEENKIKEFSPSPIPLYDHIISQVMIDAFIEHSHSHHDEICRDTIQIIKTISAFIEINVIPKKRYICTSVADLKKIDDNIFEFTLIKSCKSFQFNLLDFQKTLQDTLMRMNIKYLLKQVKITQEGDTFHIHLDNATDDEILKLPVDELSKIVVFDITEITPIITTSIHLSYELMYKITEKICQYHNRKLLKIDGKRIFCHYSPSCAIL